MLASQIPTKFPIPFGNNAATGTIRQVPTADQTAVSPGAASLATGFPVATGQPLASGGIPPAMQDFNGILFQTTAWARWQAVGGLVPYDAAFSAAVGGYPAGGTVLSATTPGRVWISSADNNTTNPDSGGANWLALMLASDVIAPATANVTVYVSPAGSDSSGTGTAAAPFATIARAVQYGASRYSFAGFKLIVQLAAGTYAPPGPIIGVPNVTVQGDTTGGNISAYTIQGTGVAGSFLIGPSSGVQMNLSGVQVINTGTIAGNIAAIQGGSLVLTNVILNATVASTSGVLVGATGGGTVTVSTGCQIGNVNFGAAFSSSTAGGITLIGNLTIGGSPNFNQAFAVATTGGAWTTLNGAGFIGSVSSVTGPRYLQTQFGTFNTAGAGVNYFPGSSAGTAAQAGAYV